MRRLLLAAAAAVAMSGPAAAATNLIVNGDFTTYGASPNQIPGWTIVDAGDPHAVTQYDPDFFGPHGLNASGDRVRNPFAVLGAYDAPLAGVSLSQQIQTVAGAEYQLTFEAGNFGPGLTPGPQAVYAEINGVSTQVFGGRGNDINAFMQLKTIDFVGAGGFMTIAFSAAGGDTRSNDLFLDNISVVQTRDAPPPVGGVAVPEPATWALMLSGFGLAGAGLRRRRSLAA